MVSSPPKLEPGPKPGERPMVERGDELYCRDPKGRPFTGKVLAAGEHGCTMRVDGKRQQVPWEHVHGHKVRVQPALSIVDEGEDGFIAKEPRSGVLRYVHDPLGVGEEDMGETPMTKALDLALRTHVGQRSGIDRILDMRAAAAGDLLAKAIKNAPGLALQDVTDRAGHQTKRWKKTSPDVKKGRPAAKPDEAAAPRRHAEAGAEHGFGTHNLGPGDEVSFEAGAFHGEGKIAAVGSKGARVMDAANREHKVLWSEIRGHKSSPPGGSKKKDEPKLALRTGDKKSAAGGGKDKPPAKAATTGDAHKGPKKEWTPPEKFIASNYAKEHDDPDVTPESILAHFPHDTAGKISEVQERLKNVEETINLQKREGAYTAQRQALHRDILYNGITKRVMNEDTGKWETKHFPGLVSPEAIKAATPAPGEKPTFTMLGGRGGSGRSWFSKSGMVDKKKAIFLDNDHIKSLLPEYEGWNAAQVHEEASEIFDDVTKFARNMGLNVVHDATMKTGSKAVDLLQKFKERGYRIEAHYMHLPRQEAAKRAVERFLGKTQRFVPPHVVLGMTTNEDSFDKVRQHADKWSFRDNNVPRGHEPVLISEGGKDSGNP